MRATLAACLGLGTSSRRSRWIPKTRRAANTLIGEAASARGENRRRSRARWPSLRLYSWRRLFTLATAPSGSSGSVAASRSAITRAR